MEKNGSLLQKSFAIEKNLVAKIYTVSLKNLYGFPVFYKVFSKKPYKNIFENYYEFFNDSFEKFIWYFCILKGFFETPYENVFQNYYKFL